MLHTDKQEERKKNEKKKQNRLVCTLLNIA